MRVDVTRYTVLPSPIGELLLTSEGEALTRLYMSDDRAPWSLEPSWRRDDGALRSAVQQVDAYFAGDLTEFDIPLAPRGTPFQQQVWAALRDIPYGETWSYGRLAAHIGRAGAARAVGLANGRNPVAIVIPCHRVIGASGALVGYGGGMPRKRLLLDLEASVRNGVQPLC